MLVCLHVLACMQGRAEWLTISPYYRDLMSTYAGKVGQFVLPLSAVLRVRPAAAAAPDSALPLPPMNAEAACCHSPWTSQFIHAIHQTNHHNHHNHHRS